MYTEFLEMNFHTLYLIQVHIPYFNYCMYASGGGVATEMTKRRTAQVK